MYLSFSVSGTHQPQFQLSQSSVFSLTCFFYHSSEPTESKQTPALKAFIPLHHPWLDGFKLQYPALSWERPVMCEFNAHRPLTQSRSTNRSILEDSEFMAHFAH